MFARRFGYFLSASKILLLTIMVAAGCHSAPYMHNGRFDTLTEIVTFYRDMSTLARTPGSVTKRRSGIARHRAPDG